MKKISLYMETTRKNPEETMAEIQQLLGQYGLKKFMADYENGEIVGCFFSIESDGKSHPYKLPVHWTYIWKLSQEGRTKYIRDERQAQRVAWRQTFRWIQAQLAMIDTRMVALTEVFLPYLVSGNGKTFYEHMKLREFKLPALNGGNHEV
jgi:hypothetical protein